MRFPRFPRSSIASLQSRRLATPVVLSPARLSHSGPSWRPILAISSAVRGLIDPTQADQIAALGEATGPIFLRKIRDKMLLDPTGRKILRERPVINSTTLDLEKLRQYPPNSFGLAYTRFMDQYHFDPDERSPVKYVDDPELAYVILRYRQVHDFWHTLSGLDQITVEAELALKWFEAHQTGLPVAILSALVGPLRLTPLERERLFTHYVPWALQCAESCKFLMSVMYEDLLDQDIDQVRKDLGFIPIPPLKPSLEP
ncbi:ubiquinone biosynthesis protein Coq4 [Polychytrium aggregatum]|uniref:ubiquinone biosynthesis protein Coq4 n=1 Tax=Polychytrium aggregatum TaxID=110093 RepID=UPI0022FDE988|nr:ubiquinone biosynthesis protein Coq4 [Polychytrium aggregatum]KAI9207572.1 ubiquinone biosynthesis protein Coq4 [Polychytrium aggregatum]